VLDILLICFFQQKVLIRSDMVNVELVMYFKQGELSDQGDNFEVDKSMVIGC
jgi:hypothetical protein